MKKELLYCLLACLLVFQQAQSQYDMPREYVPSGELVSLSGDLNIPDALDVLSEYAIKYKNKPIYDPTQQKGTIGIDIEGMAWEKALQLMLSRRGLWYTEKEHFFEVMVPKTNVRKAGSGYENDDNVELKLGNREVKIETIFFEGDRRALAQVGIDWSTFYNGKVDINAAQFGALNVDDSVLDLEVKIPNSLFSVDLQALLRILDSKNFGDVLAQPQVVVTEGNEGTIQVGQDFSIKTRDFAGNITDKFFSTGTILKVTPYVLEDEEKGAAILLDAHVERSQANPDVVSTVIKKSQATSFIQLFDGEETLIAGLYSTEQSDLRKGIPLLKDLPWWVFGIRYLAGYTRTESIQKELIIIIKATLLPDVFTRKEYPHRTKLSVRDREDFLRKYRWSRNSATHQPPPKASTREEPKNTTRSEKRALALPDQSSTPTRPLQAPVKQVNARTSPNAPQELQTSREEKAFFGTVATVQQGFVLIKWEPGFDASELHGKTLVVLRPDQGKGVQIIGQITVLKAEPSRALGKAKTKNKRSVKRGDQVVIRVKEV